MGETATEKGTYLGGLKVLEIANELGEYAGKLLAGLGADVVKVEPITPPHVGGVKQRNGPNYGEDTAEVLTRLLGLTDAEVKALFEAGVV